MLQMTWQLNLLSKRRKIGIPPLGLKNLGNTCYLNSVLQCLTYTPPLANFCLKSQHTSLCNTNNSDCPFCIIEKRIVRSLSIENHLDAPSKIQSCLNIFSDHFRCGRQEDAHEFLRYVIDACHNTCLRLSNSTNNNNHHHGNGREERETSVVKEIFGGALQSQVKCLSCGFESNKTDDIMDISLDLFQTNSLRDAMQRFFQPEVLDGSNKYKCEKCKKLVAARKQMSILQAPNILVIQLKRFEGIHGGKIDRTIAFEETLVLSSYMCKGCQDPHPEYNLFGTIVHSGYSPESGHYYAYIKDAVGRWYCCNDSHVSLSTLQEVLSEKVYILFFSRTNPRPRPTKTAIATNGVKSPNCIVNDASPNPKADKTVTAKTYDAHYLERDRPMMPKNGKPPSSPQIKFGNLNGVDPRKVHSNGNGNGIVNGNGDGNGIGNGNGNGNGIGNGNGNGNGIGNGNGNGNGNVYKPGLVGKHIELKKLTGMEKNKDDMPSVSIKNGTSGAVYRTNQQTILIPKDGIQSVSCKDMSRMSGATEANHALNDEHANCPSVISGSKRKSLDKESEGLLKQGTYWATDTKFKEALGADASAFLRSCGWSDEVHNSMRARKRQCAQAAGITASNTELKELLITEAKQTFLTQIPESLKERLIERLRAVSQGRKILDA